MSTHTVGSQNSHNLEVDKSSRFMNEVNLELDVLLFELGPSSNLAKVKRVEWKLASHKFVANSF